MKKFTYLKALNSPFKRFTLKWYWGKIAIGTPYFLPRRWIKNKDKPGYKKAIPRKIGFDIVSLGWKTKWDDFRFEWAPLISFVFFKWQIAITVVAPEEDHYWECWLYYELKTDKTKSPTERIAQCRKEYPQIWTRHNEGKDERIDMYDVVLK